MSHGDEDALSASPERVAAFLRALADHVGRDQRFAGVVVACLVESGLLAAGAGETAGQRPATRGSRQTGARAKDAGAPALDPFALWRAQGEAALRAALDVMDLTELKAIVRANRLDPARVASRWSSRERVATLILEQVKARLNHGRAFERV